ncbi:hypothetical protein GGR56DRAFT_93226 [Xylariaceae sp. FL0804]|nr:hypothetical protein GGR56DRAFT_93226 [Xylariaceae sp. FL0804]
MTLVIYPPSLLIRHRSRPGKTHCLRDLKFPRLSTRGHPLPCLSPTSAKLSESRAALYPSTSPTHLRNPFAAGYRQARCAGLQVGETRRLICSRRASYTSASLPLEDIADWTASLPTYSGRYLSLAVAHVDSRSAATFFFFFRERHTLSLRGRGRVRHAGDRFRLAGDGAARQASQWLHEMASAKRCWLASTTIPNVSTTARTRENLKGGTFCLWPGLDNGQDPPFRRWAPLTLQIGFGEKQGRERRSQILRVIFSFQ